ncbi:MAG: dihydroneopterin aldolase [Alphaproteobacteria bacterium]|nr:dihydroneopterin aldolase [Alphaproteobacteria bacterium]
MDNLYQIEINRLELLASVGILPEERVARQRILISVALESPIDAALRATSITGLVSYGEVVTAIKALVASRHIDLVEELAREILELCFAYPIVIAAEVRVEKPEIIPNAESVGCRLRLTRQQFQSL